jgi:hypothetical protein
MKTMRVVQLAISGCCAVLAFLISFISLCFTKNLQCTIGTDYKWTEAIWPLTLVFLVILIINGVILAGVAGVTFFTSAAKFQFPIQVVMTVLGGALIGFFIRLMYDLITGTFSSFFYLGVDYVPFIASGVAAAFALTFAQRRTLAARADLHHLSIKID